MPKKKSEKSLEDLIARLEQISAIIQEGEVGLEESIELYEEGKRIANECNERLTAAQKRLEIINPSLINEVIENESDKSKKDKSKELGSDNPILFA